MDIEKTKREAAAKRQRKSRANRMAKTFESFPAQQFSVMLSPRANQALRMLANYRDASQKEIIEELLIDAYTKYKV